MEKVTARASGGRNEAPCRTTLLQLVQAVQDATDSDEETVAVITHLLGSGAVRLCGTLAGASLDVAA